MKKKPTHEQFQKQLDHMVQTLRADILEGKYATGDYLPSELEQAKMFRLSNKSVRKGLDILNAEGWIEKIPRVGSRVLAKRETVRLTVGINRTDEVNMKLSGLAELFCKRYPWIELEFVPFVSDLGGPGDQRKLAEFDAIVINHLQFQRMKESGHLPLFAPLPEKREIYPFLSGLFKDGGMHYVYPIIFSPIVLCYNKRHFRERGLAEPDGSWTWDDLVRNAIELTNGNGRFGFAFYLLNENRWPLFWLQAGEDLRQEGRSPESLRHSRLMDAARLCKSIISNRDFFPMFLSENNREINAMFQEGRLSMVINSYMGMNDWQESPGLEYDVSPLPYMNEPITLMISQGVGVLKQTGHPEEAMLLADFLTSLPGQQYIGSHTLSIPSHWGADSSPNKKAFAVPGRYSMYREMMFSYRTHASLGIPALSYSHIFKHVRAYWADLIDERELCERMAEALSEREGQVPG
ncbi:extracellular solute-binding protein [Paenibacillus sp. GCM10012303]|uniref:extracellular solute-binding protein n=1 Tax=Paenibacillus sp. GCM10012303 TaxID=3317340 RepID=UPI0036118DC6